MPAAEAERGRVESWRRGGWVVVRRDGAQAPGAVRKGPRRMLVVLGERLSDHQGVASAVPDVRPAVSFEVVIPPEQPVAVAAGVGVGLAAREWVALHPGVASHPLVAGRGQRLTGPFRLAEDGVAGVGVRGAEEV